MLQKVVLLRIYAAVCTDFACGELGLSEIGSPPAFELQELNCMFFLVHFFICSAAICSSLLSPSFCLFD